MNERELIQLLSDLGDEAEATRDLPYPDPLPAGVTVTRGAQRTKTLQVRLSEAELAELESFAGSKSLPPSTAARSILLSSLRAPKSYSAALDQLERDVAALRGLSAPMAA